MTTLPEIETLIPSPPKSTTGTAPGKIILFGEHSVVYGRPALAVPVSQVVATCVVSQAPKGTGVKINAKDIDKQYQVTDEKTNNPLRVAVQVALDYLDKSRFLDDITITISSTIPMASGLGSGAAVSTAIIRALAQHYEQSLESRIISDLVFEVEKLHHGTPSGIDNTVVAYNQPVFFQHAQPTVPLRVQEPLTFVIGNTGIKSPTHKVVGDLRRRREANPQCYDQMFDKMASLAMTARTAIETGNLAHIGACMTENHQLLDQIGVSSIILNEWVEIANRNGAFGAKLSGAGWGGNMIALTTSGQAESIARALSMVGAEQPLITQVEKGY
ncbi:MAG: mevalonate kinase [Chloroflexota bacterium]